MYVLYALDKISIKIVKAILKNKVHIVRTNTNESSNTIQRSKEQDKEITTR